MLLLALDLNLPMFLRPCIYSIIDWFLVKGLDMEPKNLQRVNPFMPHQIQFQTE